MVGTAVFFWVLAALIALIEIENEGKNGWGENLPTWYRTQGAWKVIFYLFVCSRPLTGYCLFVVPFTLMVFHSCFVSGADWSLAAECSVLARYFLWCPVWDFLWFVFNPFYGVANFKRSKIWWHARSYWILALVPFDYVVGMALSVGFAVAASKLDGQFLLQDYAIMVMTFVILTMVAIVISPFYKKWYFVMRERDDRAEAGIFH